MRCLIGNGKIIYEYVYNSMVNRELNNTFFTKRHFIIYC